VGRTGPAAKGALLEAVVAMELAYREGEEQAEGRPCAAAAGEAGGGPLVAAMRVVAGVSGEAHLVQHGGPVQQVGAALCVCACMHVCAATASDRLLMLELVAVAVAAGEQAQVSWLRQGCIRHVRGREELEQHLLIGGVVKAFQARALSIPRPQTLVHAPAGGHGGVAAGRDGGGCRPGGGQDGGRQRVAVGRACERRGGPERPRLGGGVGTVTTPEIHFWAASRRFAWRWLVSDMVAVKVGDSALHHELGIFHVRILAQSVH